MNQTSCATWAVPYCRGLIDFVLMELTDLPFHGSDAGLPVLGIFPFLGGFWSFFFNPGGGRFGNLGNRVSLGGF